MTHTDIESTRDGAKSCLAALRAIEKMADVENHISLRTEPGQIWEQDLKGLQAMTDLLLRTSGITSPYVAGFLSVIAGYVRMCSTAGIPNLEPGTWVPYAAMTDAQLAESKQSFEEIT